jgi:Transposase IS66 family
VPYTNNVSERHLRPSVIFRKVTNGFRCEWGAETYAAFRSLVSTAKANRAPVLDVLRFVLATKIPSSYGPYRGGAITTQGTPVEPHGHVAKAPLTNATAGDDNLVVPTHIRPMPNHRFKIGQSVLVSSDQPSALKPEGLHQIVRLMPISGRDPQYVVHSGADGYDRLVLESQLSLPKDPPLRDRPSPSQEQAIPRARSPRGGRTRRTGGGAPG